MNLIAEHFGPTKQADVPTKPSLTSRLSKLLGKISDQSEVDQRRKLATFSELVNRLAECEVDERVKPPTADEIRIICESAGKSMDDLTAVVSQAADALRLRADLAGEPKAIDALEKIERRIIAHKTEFESTIAAMQAESDQLAAEQRTLASAVRTFADKRRQLQSITSEPLPREAEIKDEIQRLIKAERDTRVQAGAIPLLERYIGTSLSDSPEFQQLAKIKEQIELLKPKAEGKANGVAAFKLKKLYPQREALETKIKASRRLYALGDRVADIRKQQVELTAERNKLQAERLAKV